MTNKEFRKAIPRDQADWDNWSADINFSELDQSELPMDIEYLKIILFYRKRNLKMNLKSGLANRVERHNIIPRYRGGKSSFGNGVMVTPQEHIELHRILWNLYGDWKELSTIALIAHRAGLDHNLSDDEIALVILEQNKDPRWRVDAEKAASGGSVGKKKTDEEKQRIKESRAKGAAERRLRNLADPVYMAARRRRKNDSAKRCRDSQLSRRKT